MKGNQHNRVYTNGAANVRWAAMADFGAIRNHKRSGRTYLEFPGKRRLWTLRVGEDVTIPFTAETASRALERIRGIVADGLALDEALAKFQAPSAAGNLVPPKLDRWLDRMRRLVADGQRSPTYLRDLERWVEGSDRARHFAFWDGRSIYEVSFGSLEDYSFWLADRGLGAKTRWNVLAAFRSFLGWLYKRGDLAELPRDYPWPEVDETAPNVLTPAAQAAVLASIPEADRGVFLAMALMGLRPGEAVALDAGDYAAEDGWLTVRRARKGGTLDAPIRGTKTRKVKRLPVPDELRSWIAAHDTRVVSSGVVARLQRADRPLFPNPRTGDRWAATTLRRVWRNACDAVGVRVSLYEGTKHTFATDAAARGVPERALQAFLGHEDARSTRRYAKLADGALLDVLPVRKDG